MCGIYYTVFPFSTIHVWFHVLVHKVKKRKFIDVFLSSAIIVIAEYIKINLILYKNKYIK